MMLCEIPRMSKLYGLNPDGHEDGIVIFDHLDGMYSYCVGYDGEGNRLGICHLAGYAPLEEFKDGYRLVDEPVTPPPLKESDE